jgi:hypothetical protein
MNIPQTMYQPQLPQLHPQQQHQLYPPPSPVAQQPHHLFITQQPHGQVAQPLLQQQHQPPQQQAQLSVNQPLQASVEKQQHELTDVGNVALQAAQAFVGAQQEATHQLQEQDVPRERPVTKYAVPKVTPPKSVSEHLFDILWEGKGAAQ